MLKITLLSLLILAGMRVSAQNETGYFFVSSQSGEHPNGIALFSMERTSGKLTKLKEFNQVSGSSYLTISKDNRLLFTIDQPHGEKNGIITSFFIIDGGRELEMISKKEIPGSGPCYISLNESNDVLMVANYSQGNVITFTVDEDGFISDPVSNIYHQGTGINKERQEGPHPHMIIHVPGSGLVLVPDLGIDKIMLYHLEKDGKLRPASQPYADVPAGSGPRHFAFHPSMKYGYVLNELNGTVTAFKTNPNEEEMERLNTISILPDDYADFNKSADILVSPDGKYLYATNRGHNSIAIMRINESTGEIDLWKTVDCRGDFPRAFRMDPSGKFLLVANKNSGDIVVFKMKPETGDLEFISETKEFPGPQCIRFLH